MGIFCICSVFVDGVIRIRSTDGYDHYMKVEYPPSLERGVPAPKPSSSVSSSPLNRDTSARVLIPKSIETASIGEEIEFLLPDGEPVVTCAIYKIYDHPNYSMKSFHGIIRGLIESEGSCALSCRRGRNATHTVVCVGNLRPSSLVSSQYEIRPSESQEGTIHTLTKVPLEKYVEAVDQPHSDRRLILNDQFREDLSMHYGPNGPSAQLSRRLTPDDNDIMDLMIVYTPSAENQLGSDEAITLYIAHAIDEANEILDRSAIDLRLRAVMILKMSSSGYTDPNDLGTTLNQATYFGGSNSAFDSEQSLRYTVQADALVIVTSPVTPNYCGIAWLNGGASSAASKQVSVVELTCMVGYYAFIHELGHNLGAAHDRSVIGSNNGAFSYSKGWCWDVPTATACDGTCRRSVMSYASCSSSRLSCVSCLPTPYFSNPLVLESGSPTGDSSANNALTLNNNKQFAIRLQDSLEMGGLIFSVEPSHKHIAAGCFRVRINGWRIGDGGDITNVSLAGVPVLRIDQQDKNSVIVTANISDTAIVGDVVIECSSGVKTTLTNAFSYEASADTYLIIEDFEGDKLTPFYASGEGAFYFLDGACPTGTGDICEDYGPASGAGVFAMVRPDAHGRPTGITANLSMDDFCQDNVSVISVDYYAFSVYDYCYPADFLSIQVKYTPTGAWVDVSTAASRQSSNSDAWFHLSTDETFLPSIVHGVRILARSYSNIPNCQYYNPVALDNIIVAYSTVCSAEDSCVLNIDDGDQHRSSSSSILRSRVLFIAIAAVASGAVAVIAMIGKFGIACLTFYTVVVVFPFSRYFVKYAQFNINYFMCPQLSGRIVRGGSIGFKLQLRGN